MLGRFFKKDKLESSDPTARLRAVDELDDQAKLEELAASDPNLEVRNAATSRITSQEVLLKLLEDEMLASAAAKKLGAMMRLPQDGALLSRPILLSAYLDANQAEQTQDIAAYLDQPEQLAELCLKSRGEARQDLLAHDVLRTEAGLQALEKVSRNRDKACNRHARSQLETIKQAKAKSGQSLERLREIDASLERLSGDHEEANRVARISKLLSDRQVALSELETSTATLESSLSDFQNVEPPIAPTIEIEESSSPGAVVHDELGAILKNFENSISPSDPAKAVAQWQEVVKQCDFKQATSANRESFTRIDELMASTKNALGLIASFDAKEPVSLESDPRKASKSRQHWLQQWQSLERRLAWPSVFEETSQLVTLRSQATLIENELANISEAQSKSKTQLETALSDLEQSLDDNQYRDGVRHIKQVRTLINHLPKSKERQEYERKTSLLSARLNELKDWQKFATAPKREVLLTELRELAASPKEAPTQAAALKHLRSQWQTLGPTNTDEERNLQIEFDTLAEKAYEICAAYYSEQDKQRAENLSARSELCDQIANYLEETDWSVADYKAAEQIMRTARGEWRKHHPCERKALKPVEQRFEALQKQLHEKIKAEWDRNIALKESIVSRAEALLGLEDGAAQADNAKALQNEWKTIGPLPRAIDQRLWRSFRKACDQIFAERKAAFEAVREEQDREVSRLKEALNDLASLSKAPELDRAKFQDQSRIIDDLLAGMKAPKPLINDLRSIRDAFRQRITEAASEARTQEIKQLLVWDNEVNEAESNGHPIEAPHPFFASRQKNEEEVRRVLLELEIAADLPSPESDQPARMALQVELMNQGIRNTGDADPMDFLERWCALTKPNDENIHQRFAEALSAL